jgi:hypothetical protein
MFDTPRVAEIPGGYIAELYAADDNQSSAIFSTDGR